MTYTRVVMDGDPTHEFIHKVPRAILESFLSGKAPHVVTAECGKLWSPTMTEGQFPQGMRRCKACFPEVDPNAWVA